MPRESYALVSVEPSTGTLRRYEIGGNGPRLTHEATTEQPEVFSAEVVDGFRAHPEDRFAVGFNGPDALLFA